ncbi:MAG: cysteine peptidase family C39 domain-containing protein [Gemmataceae bacterium]|nr:cysteine peptidase family C39 domain-containing protein [Gemmataceae bacterium]
MPRFIAQERPDACAVACLRMLLASRGIETSEDELVRITTLDEGGLTPEELAKLARAMGLVASEQQIDDHALASIVDNAEYPIAYLYRKILDGVSSVHAVIPVRYSQHFVTLLDPLRGQRRVSRRKFAVARSMVQNWAVVVAE